MCGVGPRKIFTRIGGYVLQTDLLMATQTVTETLRFYADLHLKLDKEEKEAKVEALMHQLGIYKVKDTILGNEMMRGVSGGEMKRVAIGAALITDPSILILDEPTSGLDSFNALGIIKILKQLADNGHTIITTIHQPSSEIFGLFDTLMLMHNGRTVYLGPATKAFNYFGDIGYRCPQYYNPADFYIDLLNDEGRKIKPDQTPEFYKSYLAILYDESSAAVDSLVSVKTLKPKKKHTKGSPDEKHRVNGFLQFWYLGIRNLRNLFRDPRTSFAQLGQALFLALLIGSLYFQIDDTVGAINDRFGVIFFICTNQAFAGFTYLTKFLEERDLFQRERAAGDYSVIPYFFSRLLTELPGFVFFPLILCCIAYWMAGLNPDPGRFFIFCFATILHSMTATSLFVFIGAVAPNAQLALIISPILIVLMMLFGGFFIRIENIPVYYSWFRYCSFFMWTIELTMTNEFEGVVYNCTANETLCGNLGYFTGEQALALYGFEGVSIWANFLILIAMFIIYRTLALLAVYFLHVERK